MSNTISNILNRITEFASRKGKFSIFKPEFFQLLRDMVTRQQATELNTMNLIIRKLYTSEAAMNSDVADPVGDDTEPILSGQLVAIQNDSDANQDGNVYRYSGDAWEYVCKIGNLSTVIDGESQAREQADEELQNEINAIKSGVGLENDGSYNPPPGSNYLAGDLNISESLLTLDGRSKINADDVTSEAQSRANADNSLSQSISNEASARAQADLDLQEKIIKLTAINQDFSSELSFDQDKILYINNGTGELTFTLASSGNVIGKVIRSEINSDITSVVFNFNTGIQLGEYTQGDGSTVVFFMFIGNATVDVIFANKSIASSSDPNNILFGFAASLESFVNSEIITSLTNIGVSSSEILSVGDDMLFSIIDELKSVVKAPGDGEVLEISTPTVFNGLSYFEIFVVGRLTDANNSITGISCQHATNGSIIASAWYDASVQGIRSGFRSVAVDTLIKTDYSPINAGDMFIFHAFINLVSDTYEQRVYLDNGAGVNIASTNGMGFSETTFGDIALGAILNTPNNSNPDGGMNMNELRVYAEARTSTEQFEILSLLKERYGFVIPWFGISADYELGYNEQQSIPQPNNVGIVGGDLTSDATIYSAPHDINVTLLPVTYDLTRISIPTFRKWQGRDEAIIPEDKTILNGQSVIELFMVGSIDNMAESFTGMSAMHAGNGSICAMGWFDSSVNSFRAGFRSRSTDTFRKTTAYSGTAQNATDKFLLWQKVDLANDIFEQILYLPNSITETISDSNLGQTQTDFGDITQMAVLNTPINSTPDANAYIADLWLYNEELSAGARANLIDGFKSKIGI